MEYWHNIITEKSFALLKELTRHYDFILIGGWAVFLWTQALKSKDIDIVLSFEELGRLRKTLSVSKNARLKKYEAKKEDIDIDIYLPYYSNPGLPAEEIEKFTLLREGFRIPQPEVLLILKQKAYFERKQSVRGRKDEIDIFSLLLLPDFDWQKYQVILKQYKMEGFADGLKELLQETFEVKELNLSRHKLAKLKKEVLKKLENY